MTLDVNDGSSNRVYTFYTSTDNVADSDDVTTWTQLGTTVTTSGTTSLHDNTSEWEIGSRTGGTVERFNGLVYAVDVFDGIGGTRVLAAKATEYSSGTVFFDSEDSQGILGADNNDISDSFWTNNVILRS